MKKTLYRVRGVMRPLPGQIFLALAVEKICLFVGYTIQAGCGNRVTIDCTDSRGNVLDVRRVRPPRPSCVQSNSNVGHDRWSG